MPTSLIRCVCGASLFVSSSGRLIVAIEPNPPVFEPATSTETSSAPNVIKPKKDSQWWIVGGIGGSVLLLLISLTMFLLRSPAKDKSRSSKTRTGEVSIDPKVETVKKPILISPGTLKRLASDVPFPKLSTDKVAGDDDKSGDSSLSVGENKVDRKSAKESPYGGPTIAPKLSLPAAKKARARVSIIAPAKLSGFFTDSYSQAFQSYQDLMEMGDSKSASQAYRDKLGTTLGLVKLAYDLSLKQNDSSKQGELLYMLAFLSLKGGHVIEATVYGEMATRVGNPEANMTRDAAFIALTAAQEASSTHWGGEGEVGALLQMQTIAELIDAKWPSEPERDAIWMSLAQSYAEFGKTELAIKAYSNIRKTSPLFGEAQFGAGIAHWNTFLIEASRPQVKEQAMLSRLNKATQALAGGVEAIEARSDNPTLQLLVGKQTLAMIADRTGDWKSVKAWMTEGKFPLVRSITLETASTPGKPSKSRQPAPVVVSRALAKNVFVLLYEAATEAGDFPTAKQSLERFQSLIGDEADPDIASMRFSTAVQQIKKLIDQNSIGSQDVKVLDETLSSVLSSKSTTPDEKLWIAQSWATLAGKKNAAVVGNSCYQRAAAICNQAIETKGFTKTSLPATRLRQAEWLRLAGDYEESLQVVTELLTSSPNALDVQLQAALSFEAFAIARDSEGDLLRVIDTSNSTDDDKSNMNFSTIWGWNKLTSQLHQVRYSNKGTSQHGNLLLMAHFHLARSRWMLMSVTDEGADRDKLKARIANQLKSAKLAIPLESPDANTWQAAFENLESKLTP